MTLDFTKWAVKRRQKRCLNTKPALDTVLDEPIIGFGKDEYPIIWPRPTLERAASNLILGSSGCGKTVLCANALVQELAKDGNDDLAFLVVDPKGDLVEAMLQGLATIAPHRLEDVFYLDPFSVQGFPFNLNHLALGKTPVDVRSAQIAELVATISTAMGAQKHLGVGARQVDVLTHLILGSLTCPDPRANVLWALDALTTLGGFKRLAGLTTSARAKHFLSSSRLAAELKASSSSRLRSALAMSEQLERLVAAPDCIQWEELLAPGKITVLHLGQPTGGMASLREFYGNLICRLAIDFLLSRPSPWRGHHVRMVVDEVQIVAPALSDSAEAILTTGRSRGVSLTAISQGTILIERASETLLRTLFTNSPLKFIGRLSAPDAEMLAREQAPKQGTDENVAAVRSRFSTSVCNLEDRSFFRLLPGDSRRFRTAEVDMDAWQKSAEEKEEEIRNVKNRLALPPDMKPRVTLAEATDLPSSSEGRPRKRRTRKPEADSPAPARSKPRSRWG